MKYMILAGWLLSIAGALPAAESASTPQPAAAQQGAAPALISRVGFFYRAGNDVARDATGIMGDTSDYIRAHQIAVLYFLPAQQSAKAPLIILPGFGISVETFLQTPDGRPGWAMAFLAAGYPVYLVEPSHTTRSGIDSGFYLKQQDGGGTGQLFTWGGRQVWTRWGLGPEYGVAAKDGRFPVQHYDQVVSSFTAIETDRIDGFHNIEYQLASNVRALSSLLEEIGPATILTHSASGLPAFEVAMQHPHLVNALVAIEPVGCPAKQTQRLKDLPVMAVFGDHMQWRPQMPARRDECQAVVEQAGKAGLPAKMLDLPKSGIKGNSHLMYMENNSDEIAGYILDWLAAITAK